MQPEKPKLINTPHHSSGFALSVSGQKVPCVFDLFFDSNGMPHARIQSYKQALSTAFYGLDPAALRPSTDPRFEYEYLEPLPMQDASNQ